MIKLTVTKKDESQKIEKYVKKALSEAPLSFIYKLFRKKDVKVNGHWVKPEYVISSGEEIAIYITDLQLEEFKEKRDISKANLPYEIVYEDKNILLVNKPRGVLVHGDAKEKKHTLANDVINYLYFKGEYDPNLDNAFTPAPAHRLDRNTSGIVAFAKNLNALHSLEELFKDKVDIEKHYQALVVGELKEGMEISAPLKKDANTGLVKVTSIKDGGMPSLSIVKPLKHYSNYTLVDVNLVTGRTHQIRVHLSYKGYPVVGDSKYGNFEVNKLFKKDYHFENQFLHAYSLKFKEIKGPLEYLSNKEFKSQIPEYMGEILKKLK